MYVSQNKAIHIALAGSALASILAMPSYGMAAQGKASGSAESMEIEEIIITATKRPEAVRDISGSVSAITGSQMEKIGAESMSDYLTRTPGVVFNASTPGNSTVVIRGVSTTTGIDQGQGTTGYFINEVPLTDPSYSIATPDIDTFDVENVAVLRGPQGTLFGSSSLGGAVNYKAAEPSLDGWDMRMQSTIQDTKGGATGYTGKVMLNVPLVEDKLAVRGVFVYRKDAGFIDNIGTGVDNANRTLVRGGRVQALWQPSEDTKFTYLYLQQTQNTRDNGYQSPDIADFMQKNTLLPETSNFGTLIHNLRMDHDFSFATLTATVTSHQKTQDTIADYTPSFGAFFPGTELVTVAQPAKSKGETYEIRLASNGGERFDYVVGVMHDNTHQYIKNIAVAEDGEAIVEAIYGPLFGEGIGALSASGGLFLNANLTGFAKESALFGEGTFHFNDQWKVTVGGRLFHQQIKSRTVSDGFYTLFVAGALESDVEGTQKATGFNPKASLTWTPNDDFMSYFLVSKGFRFGGPNIIQSTPATEVPLSYDSDSLINYELGTRSTFLDKRLQLDATAFYIDWSDIQLRLRTPEQLNYATNAGKARIYGLEASASFVVTEELMLSSNATYLNAKLDEDFNPGGGEAIVPKGTTLPGASRWQVANTLSYDWAESSLEPTLVLAHRYISSAPGGLISGTPQGGYNIFDARVGVQFGRVGVTAFVNNIGNSHGVTSGTIDPLQLYIVRPRTVGLTLNYKL
ncbi:TonB-dependent receptor [Kordiimonas pumila]|uniref:TonB-dependent receptor n=1 Tax=Kordiimonas pumila TaxID=2161677 RepID=A0ABV7D4X0_9PROT|nr:TonB-dependent receptor [Kordiimonas pumila]